MDEDRYGRNNGNNKPSGIKMTRSIFCGSPTAVLQVKQKTNPSANEWPAF
jgi:hypothetical protein